MDSRARDGTDRATVLRPRVWLVDPREQLDRDAPRRRHLYREEDSEHELHRVDRVVRAVAQRLTGFETKVIYNDLIKADAKTEKTLNASFASLDQLLTESDILTIHTPLDDSTKGVMDASVIGKMKKSAIIINCARGGIINEQDLYNAITSGRIRGAGIDVWEPEPTAPENPLLKLDQVVVTPHAAGSAFDNVGNVSAHCFRNIELFLRGEPQPKADVVIPIKSKSSAAE